jgi:hypothetical protein
MARALHILLIAPLVLSLALSGPGRADGGGSLSSPELALSGVYSAQAVISDDAHHVLMGHVIVARQGRDIHIALIIQQRRDGVHFIGYRQAFSGGVELPYRRMRGTGCTHGHCRDRPVGLIALNAAMLARYAQSGLEARLTGRSGAIALSVPAALFAEAQARAAAADLVEPAPDG